MSALDDLNQAVSDLTASVAAEIAALEAALSSNNDQGIEAAVANLKNLNTQLQTSIAPPVPTA